MCEAVSGASESLMRSAGKPILGVRWCAWDDAEALEGAAGSGLERLVRTTARTALGHVGHSVPNLASSYVATSSLVFPQNAMISSSLETSLSQCPFMMLRSL